MGIPIRWDNINGPDFRTPAALMGQAQQSMNGALGGLQGIVQGMNNLEQENWNTGKVNNTNAFMRQLLGYKTPEEYQAAMQSGALNQQLTGFGAQVDSDAALKAMDRRLVTLQQRDLSDLQYQDAKTNIQQAPIKDRIAMKIALGQIPAAMAEIEANPGLRNVAPLAQAIDAKDWTNKLRGQQQTEWKHNNELAPEKLNLVIAQGMAAMANAEWLSTRAFLEANKEGKDKDGKGSGGLKLTPEEVAGQTRDGLLLDSNPAAPGSANGFLNRAAVQKQIKDVIPEHERQAFFSAVAPTLAKGIELEKGKFTHVPVEILNLAVSRISEDNRNWLRKWWSNREAVDLRPKFEEVVKGLMKDPEVLEGIRVKQVIDARKLLDPGYLKLNAKRLGGKLDTSSTKVKPEGEEEDD